MQSYNWLHSTPHRHTHTETHTQRHTHTHTHTHTHQENTPVAVPCLALVGSCLTAHSSSYLQVPHLEQGRGAQPLVHWIVTRLLQVGLLGAGPTGRRQLGPLRQVQGLLQACPVTELASSWLLQNGSCRVRSRNKIKTKSLELTYSPIYWEPGQELYSKLASYVHAPSSVGLGEEGGRKGAGGGQVITVQTLHKPYTLNKPLKNLFMSSFITLLPACLSNWQLSQDSGAQESQSRHQHQHQLFVLLSRNGQSKD